MTTKTAAPKKKATAVPKAASTDPTDLLDAAIKDHDKAVAALAAAETAVERLLEQAANGVPVAGADLMAARADVELSGARTAVTAESLEAAKRAVFHVDRMKLIDSLYADPLINGHAERGAIVEFMKIYDEAREKFYETIKAIHAAHRKAAQDASALELPRATANLSLEGSIFTPNGSPVGVVEGKGVALANKPFRLKNARTIISETIKGEYAAYPPEDGKTPYVQIAQLPTTNDVEGVDGDAIRKTIAAITGSECAPLGKWDYWESSDGLWVCVDSTETVDVSTITFTAFGFARGNVGFGSSMARGEEARHLGGYIVSAWNVHREPTTGGYIVNATVSDPNIGERENVQDVARAVLEQINKVPLKRWGNALEFALSGPSKIGAVSTEVDGAVEIRFSEYRNGQYAGPLTLPPAVIRDVLTGLPILGWGVIDTVNAMGSGGCMLVFSPRATTTSDDNANQ